MDTSIGQRVRWLLNDCKLAGIDVELDGDHLKVRGSQDRNDLYELLKDHKDDVVYALNNIPDAVETHYLSRLRQGREWLNTCMDRLAKNPSDDKLSETLVNNIMKWALIDDEMRRLYPEFRGCSLSTDRYHQYVDVSWLPKCDDNYAPIRCDYCAGIARKKLHDND